VSDELDVAIEMVGAFPQPWKQLMRARGKKMVYLCCGQPYVALAEQSIFERQNLPIDLGASDQVWVLPKDRDFIPMMRVLYRCPVLVAPYVWSPYFLEDRIVEVSRQGHLYGYPGRTMNPEDQGFRMAMFEPNVSVVKNCVVSMLGCDVAYREEPQSVQLMNVLCSEHMVQHPSLLHLGNSLDLVRDHRAVFWGRFDVVSFMAQHANAVISHQWQNEQNYSYLDALYGGYPLIHNSAWLWNEYGAGYYYPEFESGQAARQVVRAWREHDDNLAGYKAKAQQAIQGVSPFNPRNVQRMADLIQGLFA
jgi:hypothetical protein